MFNFTSKSGNSKEIGVDIDTLISAVHDGTPWYINRKNPENSSIMTDFDLSYNVVISLRSSAEYLEAVEAYISNNQLDVEPQSLGAGIKRRGSNHRHPESEKHVIWGKIISDTDDEVIIQKLPDIVKEQDPLKSATKADLIEQVKSLRERLEDQNNDQVSQIADDFKSFHSGDADSDE